MDEDNKRGRGRPPFEPTDEQRYTAEVMAGIGLPHDQMAQALDISLPTLLKYFRAELDAGKAKTVTKVGESLVRQALAGNLGAAIFYLKTQAGWKEASTLTIDGNLTVITGVPEPDPPTEAE